MLALAGLPVRYQQWNNRHGAPYGRPIPKTRMWGYFQPSKSVEQLRGPFSIQPNNTTREFEYPWAFESAQLKPGMQVAELGGGLSGFQFLLNRRGCHVVNVDPGMEANGRGWPCDHVSIEKLNHIFGTKVELRNCTIQNAKLGENTMDRVFSISVIEHLTDPDIIEAMRYAHNCLKLGGLFILTVDLFLNLDPFCSRQSNEFGKNTNIRWLSELDNWELLVGNQNELFGFPSFSADGILSNLEKYFIGRDYPVMVQCVVLKKRA
jgi:hypothetical protein